MTKHLHYVVPIFLIGLIAGAAPASATLRSDGGTRDPVAAPAESTDAPIILRSAAGVVAAGVAVVVVGCVQVAEAREVVMPAGHEVVMPEAREAVMPAGHEVVMPEAREAVMPAGAATGPAFPQVTAASTPVTSTAPTSTLPMSTETSTFPAAVMGAVITAGRLGGVAAGVAAGAVVGAAATAVATPNYYAAPAAAYCPYPNYPNCGLY